MHIILAIVSGFLCCRAVDADNKFMVMAGCIVGIFAGYFAAGGSFWNM